MWMICKKEWNSFFGNLTGYISIIIFLLMSGLLFFVFPDTSLLDFGYASLNNFFTTIPWLLLFFIPTITMRSMADEYKTGTFELLKTLPLKPQQIVLGKFFGTIGIGCIAILPTITYAFTLQHLSSNNGIDVGSTIGSYVGLILLSAVFIAAGICSSSYTNNTVVAFIAGAFACFIFFTGFDAISTLPFFKGNADYYIEMLGINFHYKSISRGVIDSRDIIYFFAVIYFFLFITKKNIEQR
jgi:ABC-2 type transport system permease protein